MKFKMFIIQNEIMLHLTKVRSSMGTSFRVRLLQPRGTYRSLLLQIQKGDVFRMMASFSYLGLHAICNLIMKVSSLEFITLYFWQHYSEACSAAEKHIEEKHNLSSFTIYPKPPQLPPQ